MHLDAMDALQGERIVGMAGTFDVENYGDLLFPLIAAEALKRCDARIKVAPFSANARSAPLWPFDVAALDDLPSSLPSLAAMLIGGGQIVRFDGTYPVAVPDHVEMPVAYWLVPAMLAALDGKPVIWNGVGAWTDSPRAPGDEALLRQVLAASAFVGVRDPVSRDHLARIAPEAGIELLPDTAFGLSRLWPLGDESPAFAGWRGALGLEGPYVVVQADRALAAHRSAIESVMTGLGVADAVILPISPCHGDRAEAFPRLAGRTWPSREWPPPLLIAEILGRARFVFASSLHACITASSYGVPAALSPRGPDRKFELLDGLEGVAALDDRRALSRLAARPRGVEPRVAIWQDRLDRHWDDVASAALRPSLEHGVRARRLMLEAVARRLGDGNEGTLVDKPAELLRRALLAMRIKRLTLRNRLLSLRSALSQALGRFVPRRARSPAAVPAPGRPRPREERLIDMRRIAEFPMHDEPYRWAEIDGLFSPADAAALAASFPRDKFREVAGYDGEKGFQYVARSLVHMGASAPSHPEGLDPLWLALAEDLLSPEYRQALSAASGLDLSAADMEVNVIHYGPGAWLGPHVDLKEKILTHILYFNEEWDPRDGGCLNILRSKDPDAKVAEIQPFVGNSSLLVRSERSWHSVSAVSQGCSTSRRSLNVIFHLPGSVSTMWPPRARIRLRDYAPAS